MNSNEKIKPISYYIQIVISFLCALVTILSINTVYYNGKFKTKIVGALIVLSMVMVLYSLVLKRADVQTGRLFHAIILIVSENILFFIWVIIHLSSWETNTQIIGFIGTTIVIFDIFCVYFLVDTGRLFFKQFVNVAKILSAVSIFYYFFGTILGLLHSSGQMFITWGWPHYVTSYNGVYFETQRIWLFGRLIGRNSSIFTEAPMFGLLLSLALIIKYVLLKEKFNWTDCFLLVAAVITYSTTVDVVIVMIGLYLVFKIVNIKSLSGLAIISAIIVISALVLTPLVIEIVANKSSSGSGSLRIDDYVAGFHAWLLHPLIGNGWNNTASIAQFMQSSNRIVSNSGLYVNLGLANAITPIFSDGGVLLATFYIIPLIRSWNINRVLIVIFVFLLSVSVFNYLPIMFIILAYFTMQARELTQ